jgi:hypothetical protein
VLLDFLLRRKSPEVKGAPPFALFACLPQADDRWALAINSHEFLLFSSL